MFNNNGLGGSNNHRMSIVRQNSVDNNAPAGGIVNPAFVSDELGDIWDRAGLSQEQAKFLSRMVEVDHEYKPEKTLYKVGDIVGFLEKPKVREALQNRQSANNSLGQSVVAKLTSENQIERVQALMELGSSELEETALGEIVAAKRSLRSAVNRLGVHTRRLGYAALTFLGLGTIGLISSTIAAGIGALAFMGTLGMMASGGLMAIGVIIGLVVLGIISYQAARGAPTPEVKYVQEDQVTRLELSGIDRAGLSDDLQRRLDQLEALIGEENNLFTHYTALSKLSKSDPQNSQRKEEADKAKEQDRQKIREILALLEELLNDTDAPSELKLPPELRLQLAGLRAQYLAKLQTLDNPESAAAAAGEKVEHVRQLEKLKRDVLRAHHNYLSAVSRSYPNPANPPHGIEIVMRQAETQYRMALTSIIQYLNTMATNSKVAKNEEVTRKNIKKMLVDYSRLLDALNSSDIPLVNLVNVLKLGYDQAKENADKEKLPPHASRDLIRILRNNRSALRALQDQERELMDRDDREYLGNLEAQREALKNILALVNRLDDQIPAAELNNAFGVQLEVEGDLRKAESALVDYKIGQLTNAARQHARDAARAARDRGADGAAGGANDSSNLVGGANNGPASDGGAAGGANNGPASDGGAAGGANNDPTHGGGAVGGAGGGDSSDDSDDEGNGGPDQVGRVNTPTGRANDRLDGLLDSAHRLENAVLMDERPRAELEQELDGLERQYEALKTASARDGVILNPLKKVALELALLRARLLLNKAKTGQDGWDKQDGSGGGPNSPAAQGLRGLLNDATNQLDRHRPIVTALGPNHPERVELSGTMGNVRELIDLLNGRLAGLEQPAPPPPPIQQPLPPPPPPPEPPKARVPIVFDRGAADDEQGAIGGAGAVGGTGPLDPTGTAYWQLALNAAGDSLPFDSAAARELGMTEVRESFETVAERLREHLRKAVADKGLVKEGKEKDDLNKFLSPDNKFPPFYDPSSAQPQRRWFNDAIDYFTWMFQYFRDAEIENSLTASRVNTLRSYMEAITSLRDTYYASGAKTEVGTQLYVKVAEFIKEAERIRSPSELATQEAQRLREDQLARSRSLRLDARPRPIVRRGTERRGSEASTSSDASASVGAAGRK